MKNFTLPEKWYIERNVKNRELINQWFNINHPFIYPDNKIYIQYTGDNGYMSYPRCDIYTPNSELSDLLKNGYEKITFDQFKQYVIKIEPISNESDKIVQDEEYNKILIKLLTNE